MSFTSSPPPPPPPGYFVTVVMIAGASQRGIPGIFFRLTWLSCRAEEFRSLWATCMTVTMTTSGAQLLLLALCVYRGLGQQQSAPRVCLSFKASLFVP
ncbi:hypothetical protein PAMP_012373 [Pampus punctatissimus]